MDKNQMDKNQMDKNLNLGDKVLVGVPFFNELNNLARLTNDLAIEAKNIPADFLFFDDGSTDGSPELVTDLDLNLIQLGSNQGYGHAVKEIFRFAVDRGYSHFAIFPGDYQRSFTDLKKLLSACQNTDFVLTSKLRTANIPWVRKFGNYFFSFLIALICQIRPTDVLGGFKIYRVAAVQPWLAWLPSGYEFDLCFIYTAIQRDLKFKKIRASANYVNQTSKMKSGPGITGLIIFFRFLKYLLFRKTSQNE